jgi:hypothetical protein
VRTHGRRGGERGHYGQKIAVNRGDEVGRSPRRSTPALGAAREAGHGTYISGLHAVPERPGSDGGCRHPAGGPAGVDLRHMRSRRWATTPSRPSSSWRRTCAYSAGARQGDRGCIRQRVLVSFTGDNRAFRALGGGRDRLRPGGEQSAFDEAEPPVLAITEERPSPAPCGERAERVVVGRPLLLLEGCCARAPWRPGDVAAALRHLGDAFNRSGGAPAALTCSAARRRCTVDRDGRAGSPASVAPRWPR